MSVPSDLTAEPVALSQTLAEVLLAPFVPMADKGEGWEKFKRSIRAELDESRLGKFHGPVSLPFAAGDNRKIALLIVDDRGNDPLKVMKLEY